MQIKLNDLDTRLTRIERVVTNNSLLDISNQMGRCRRICARCTTISTSSTIARHDRKQQRDLYADLDQRLKALEARAGSSGAADGVAAPAGPAGPPGSTVARQARRAARRRRRVRAGGRCAAGRGGRRRYRELPGSVRASQEQPVRPGDPGLSIVPDAPIPTVRSPTMPSTGWARRTT